VPDPTGAVKAVLEEKGYDVSDFKVPRAGTVVMRLRVECVKPDGEFNRPADLDGGARR